MKKTTNTNFLLLILIALGICSCSTLDMTSGINMNDLEAKECEVSAKDLFASIQNIPLENTDSCILSTPSIVYFGDDGIVVWDDVTYHFDKKGHFINRIGKIGHGYGEYVSANSVNYDPKLKTVFIGTFSNEIYKYDISGKFIGKFSVSGGNDILLTSKWSPALGLYVCENRQYSNDGLSVSLTTWTKDGKRVASYPVYADDKYVERNYTATGSLHDVDEGIVFKLPFHNMIYKLTKDGLNEEMELDFGDHTPTRDLLENRNNSKILDNKKYVLNNWCMTPKHIYMQISCKGGYRDVLVRRSDKSVIHNRYYKYNDNSRHIKLKQLTNGTFWPWRAVGNKVADTIERNTGKNYSLIIATEQ